MIGAIIRADILVNKSRPKTSPKRHCGSVAAAVCGSLSTCQPHSRIKAVNTPHKGSFPSVCDI